MWTMFMLAIKKYAGAVEKNFSFKIDVKSFPVAFVLDSSTLDGDNPSFKVKTSAAERYWPYVLILSGRCMLL